ncbi:MAG: hypothetical protein O3B45_09270, partial [Bacteroidetes bacterium]|nr:hypothetical protein [Bacteroidota bacterium]
MHKPLCILYLLLLFSPSAFAAQIIHHQGPNLQQTINTASPYATILCDRNERLSISATILINKPLTLQGLNAALIDSLGKTPILRVVNENVTITDFELYGNTATVEQAERAPLIVIEAGKFRVERGRFVNSTKDGVEINTVSDGGDIVGGIVRDIVGEGVVRDVVSISGSGRSDGLKVRNVFVENIRGINSKLRGVVEVSDGTDNITVRTVFAEKCVYAIDVQDHKKPKQINNNIVIQDVYAVDCRHAIRTANRPFGHSNLTIRDVVAERCERPLDISNTNGLTLDNIRIIDHIGERPAVYIKVCNDVSMRNFTITGSGDANAVLIENAGNIVIDGLTLNKGTGNFASGLTYRISEDTPFTHLRIRN